MEHFNRIYETRFLARLEKKGNEKGVVFFLTHSTAELSRHKLNKYLAIAFRHGIVDETLKKRLRSDSWETFYQVLAEIKTAYFLEVILGQKIEFHIKDDGDPVAAFDIAWTIGAQVITCSWGWSESDVQQAFTQDPNGNFSRYLRLLEQAIRDAVNDGVVVLFASGNGPLPGSWPSGMPEVISVGGALIETNGGLRASDYATSFISQVYPNRHCPDVCGLVGPAPYGLLIMMPTQPNNQLDGEFSAIDGTEVGDGWLVASGTSSATPQVAGMVALLLQTQGNMNPAQVKVALQEMAVGVTQGRSASGHQATSQRPNLATGYGLVTLRRPNRARGYTLL